MTNLGQKYNPLVRDLLLPDCLRITSPETEMDVYLKSRPKPEVTEPDVYEPGATDLHLP